MDFILMLIAFFNLSVSASDLSDAEVADLESQYYEAQAADASTIDGIRREIQTLR